MIRRFFGWLFNKLRGGKATRQEWATYEGQAQSWKDLTEEMARAQGLEDGGAGIREAFEGGKDKRKPKLPNPGGFTDEELQMRQGYMGPLHVVPPPYLGSAEEEIDAMPPIKIKPPTDKKDGKTCTVCFGWGCPACSGMTAPEVDLVVVGEDCPKCKAEATCYLRGTVWSCSECGYKFYRGEHGL